MNWYNFDIVIETKKILNSYQCVYDNMQSDDWKEWIVCSPRDRKKNNHSEREERTQRKECREAIERYSQCSWCPFGSVSLFILT